MSSSFDPVPELGVVGLGDIGGNLLAGLVEAGGVVAGWDVDIDARTRAAQAGGLVATGLADLVASVPVVVTSLPSTAAIEAVYNGPDGLSAAGRRIVTCDLSTMSPALSRRIAEVRAAAGGAHVEGAVIGVGRDARARELHLLLAGPAEAVAALGPLAVAAGRGVTTFGTIGHATLAKLINNGVGQATQAALAEGLALAGRAGLDATALVDAMLAGRGAGHSVALERFGAFMARDEDGAGPAAIAVKDAEALAATIKELGAEVPILRLAAETLRAAVAEEGCGRQAVALARRARRRAGSVRP